MVALLAAGGRTDVVQWSPLNSAGKLKASLTVSRTVSGRCTDIGYTQVGGIAYRCAFGHYLFNACWREGPTATEFVVCIGNPWQRGVWRLRSPDLLLFPGVTFDPPARSIHRADGNKK